MYPFYDRVYNCYLLNLINHNNTLRQIISTIYRADFELYLVGGCLRDNFMEKKPIDIDLVTNAKPEEIIELFPDRKVECRGASFLVTVVDGYEIATYRKDSVNTGLHSDCKVESVGTLKEDLARRDFTCNAIAFSLMTGEFFDPYYGKADIDDRVIKFVGDPDQRINDDYERILRACRFVSNLEGYLEASTLDALRKNVSLVQYIPKERIQLEIVKAMKTKKASRFFESLHHIGALKYIFPSLCECYDHDGGPHHAETVFAHCMEVGDSISTKNWKLKLAGYLHDVGKPSCAEISAETMALRFRKHPDKGAELVQEELKNLKFSNKTVKYISNLVLLHMSSLKEDFSKRAVKRFLLKLKRKNLSYQEFLKLLIADRKGNYKQKNFTFKEIFGKVKLIRNIIRKEQMFSLKDLMINGQDIMKITGLNSGPEVGKILKELFEDCLENYEHNNREYLLNQLCNYKLEGDKNE